MAGKHEYGAFRRLNRAYAEGREAAFTGGSNPHVSGSSAYTAWQAGYAATGADSTGRSGQTAGSVVSFVTFAADDSPDRLSLATSGGTPLATTASFRAVIAAKFTRQIASLPAGCTAEMLLHVGASTATQYIRLDRQKSTGKIRLSMGTSGLVLSSGTYNTPTDVVKFLISYDGGLAGSASYGVCDIYVNGVYAETIVATGAANTLALSSATQLAIGAAISTYTSASTFFHCGQLSAIRCWFDSAASPIQMRYPFALSCSISSPVVASAVVPVNTTNFLTAGDVVTFDGGIGATTIATVDSTTQITLTAPITAAGGESGTWTSVAGADIAAALATPTAGDGSVAGQDPGIYFGQQTLAAWNAAANQGTISGTWTAATLT